MDLTVSINKQKIQLIEVFFTNKNLRIKFKFYLLLRRKVVMSSAKSLFHKFAPKTSDTNPLQFVSLSVSKPDTRFPLQYLTTVLVIL